MSSFNSLVTLLTRSCGLKVLYFNTCAKIYKNQALALLRRYCTAQSNMVGIRNETQCTM